MKFAPKFFIILTILLMSLMLASAAMAATNLAVTPDTPGDIRVGESTTVTLRASEVSNLYGGDIKLHFDPALLQVTSFSTTGILSGVSVTAKTYYDNTAGLIRIVSSRSGDNNGFTGDGAICSVTFNAVGSGNALVEISEYTLSDSEGAAISSAAANATLVILPVTSISGQISLQGLTGYAGQVQITLVDELGSVAATTTTDASGNYYIDTDSSGRALTVANYGVIASKPVYLAAFSGYFTTIPGGTYNVPAIKLLVGDTSLDNSVGLPDLVGVAQLYDGTFVCTDQDNWIPAADFNRDNTVSLFDLVLLARNYGKVGYGGIK